MVRLYYRHRARRPASGGRSPRAPPRHRAASDLQRSLRRRAADRRRGRARLPARAARDPGPRRFDGRHEATSPRGRSRATGRSASTSSHVTRDDPGRATRPARSQTGLATATGEFLADLRRGFRPRRRTCSGATLPHFSDPRRRHGPGALGAPEPRLLAADAHPVDLPGRPLRHRAHGPPPLGPLLQLQRDGGHLAARAASRRPAAGSRTR